MFQNYLKTALRSLGKNRLSTLVNLLGLTLGLGCVIVAFAFVRYERSFDRFHEDYERIFRLTSQYKDFFLSSSPPPLAPAVQAFFPEVESTLRLGSGDVIVEHGNQSFREQAHFADPGFFSFFDFPVVEGPSGYSLSKPGELVITESVAAKYFGRQSPVGQTLTLRIQEQAQSFTIRAVAADPPGNSSLQFGFLMPLSAKLSREAEGQWMNYSLTTMVKLRGEDQQVAVRVKMRAFIDIHLKEAAAGEGTETSSFHFGLQPFSGYRLGGESANALSGPANPRYLWIFSVMALLILVVACLNFANLSNAGGSGRLTEIGVRKVLGAGRGQLARQFLAESLVMSGIALLAAIVLVEISLPYLNNLTGYTLKLNYARDPELVGALLLIAGITGILAGSYPALLLSRLGAGTVFQPGFKIGGYNWFTRSSIGFQFCLSIGLIACTLVMWQQQRYIRDRDLGFDKEQMLIIPTQYNGDDPEAGDQFVERFSNRIRQEPGVKAVTATYSAFTRSTNVHISKDSSGNSIFVFFYRIDDQFIPTLDLKLLEGRNLSNSIEADRQHGIIVNEAYLDVFGIKDPAEARLPDTVGGIAAPRIVGVVRDFHFQSLNSRIEPAVLYLKPQAAFGDILVKVAPGDMAGTIARLRHVWQELQPSKPFEFLFLDESIQQQYETEQRWSAAIRGGALLAVLIACLGLFGLTALAIARRTREIGIRKVLGASYLNLMALLSRQFFVLVLAANAVALPLAWWAMSRWLEGFAYRIELGWPLFALAGVLTLVLALLTVVAQASPAAMMNPVRSLKHE